MFTMKPELKGYLENTTLGLYLRSIETVEIEGLVVDVRNVLERRFLCDGARCLQPSEGGAAVKGDCCQGSDVLLSDLERERLAAHLEGIMPYMAPEARAWLEASLRARAPSTLSVSGREAPQGEALARSGGDKSLAFYRPHT